MVEHNGIFSATTELAKKNKCFFLDRDGIINVDHGYVFRSDNFDFIDGIFELVDEAIQNGYLIIIITNQAGIGRGYYSEKDFYILTEWMCHQFLNKGITISKVYHCSTHPLKGLGSLKVPDPRRKPNPGMILEAQKDFNIDLSMSLFLGDKVTDMQAGLAAGVGKNIWLKAKNSPNFGNKDNFIEVDSLASVANFF